MDSIKTAADFKKVKLSLYGIVIFEDVLQDDKVNAFINLLEELSGREADPESLYAAYHRFYKVMVGVNWVEYLVQRLFDAENEFVLLASQRNNGERSQTIRENVARDLKIFQGISQIQPKEIVSFIAKRFDTDFSDDDAEIFTDELRPENWPVWIWRLPETAETDVQNNHLSAAQWLKDARKAYVSRFIQQENWEDNAAILVEYYQKVGYGMFGTFGAFRLPERGQKLEGINNPDPVHIRNLIGQEREQSLVLQNTESFLRGYPANNVILYGNRGTGKSSLVKALLNTYIHQGLRLVQMKKNQIGLFPELVRDLARVPLKFIIFIDDLSFNDLEEDYKNLKSLLEGGVESRPDNVLVYATSNRRHLVKESFADRRSDDVHAHDNREETLSLADRFGITVTFLSPDQDTYLKIVAGLALQNNIEMDPDELRQKALKWVMLHNGRSGRTARQFIDHLIGEIADSRK